MLDGDAGAFVSVVGLSSTSIAITAVNLFSGSVLSNIGLVTKYSLERRDCPGQQDRGERSGMARDKLAVAHRALDNLNALRGRSDQVAAGALFQMKDEIEIVIAGGNCDAAIRCLEAITRLAQTTILDPHSVRDNLWVAAIDATQEWVWVKE